MGPEEFPPERLLPDFPPAEYGRLDVICYGHLHEMVDATVDGIRFVNGGRGIRRSWFRATVAWLRISGAELTVEFEEFAPAD